MRAAFGRALASWPRAWIVHMALLTCAALTALALYVTCPFLNFDDVVFNAAYFDYLNTLPFFERVWFLLMNADVARGQFRTYGLARLIQYAEIALLGRSPLAVYITIAVLQAASAVALFWALHTLVRDNISRVLLAFLWAANPIVLLLSHTLHHHLYLVGPFYFLILWIGVTLNRPRIHWSVGTALLTCSWLMGESPLPAIALLLLMLAATRPAQRRSAAWQAVTTAAIFAAYVAYQRLVIYDPTLERWPFAAGFGFAFIDPNYGSGRIAGIAIDRSAFFWVPLVVLLATIPFRKEVRPAISRKALPAVALFAASSIALFFTAFVVTGMPPFTLRYVIGTGSVSLICATLIAAGIMRRPRAVIAIVCAVSLSVSIAGSALLHPTVYATFEAHAARFAEGRKEGKTAVLIYNRFPAFGVPRGDGGHPALATIYDSAVQTPFVAMWLADYYLRLILGYQVVGSDFREVDAARVELTGPGLTTTVDKKDLVIVGMESATYPVRNAPVTWYKSWDEFQLDIAP